MRRSMTPFGCRSSLHWLVVTSANAVRVIGERLTALGLRVGVACASALRGCWSFDGRGAARPWAYGGGCAGAICRRGAGGALADRVRGQRVLLVRAAVARDVVPEVFKAAGATVTIVDAYRTVVPADAVERAKAIFGAELLPDAVVFTSGSTVTHLLDVLREAGLVLPRDVACVSIGPVTSAALRDAGLSVAAEAATASLDGLVDACVRLFAR